MDDYIGKIEKNIFDKIKEKKDLIILENNLSFEITNFKNKKFKKIFLICNKNEKRFIKLSEKVLNFKSLLIGLLKNGKLTYCW